jgi:hypothetical protein
MKSNMQTVWSDVPEKQARDRQYGLCELLNGACKQKGKWLHNFVLPPTATLEW